jgi:MYXO-CTERM domain-containing protein
VSHDFDEVVLCEGACADSTTRHPMQWYGGALWRGSLPGDDGAKYQVCATDAAGNQACSDVLRLGEDKTDGLDEPTTDGGCTCAAGPGGSPGPGGLLIVLIIGIVAARPRRRR